MLTTERKQELKTFDRSLLALVKLAPDEMSRHELYRALHFFRKRYCKTYEQKKAEVMARIADGVADARELARVTGYKQQKISRILLELLEAGQIERHKLRILNSGRPNYFYTVSEKCSRSN